MESDLLYFAYGQNLNSEDLTAWCRRRGYPYPLGEKVANAYLPDTRIIFNYYSAPRQGGVINLRYQLGHVTPGVLFRVATGGWEALDAKGQEENMYKHINIVALTEDGCEHVAIAYQIRKDKHRDEFVPPHAHYLQVVREGLLKHGFEDTALKAAAEGREPPYLIRYLFVYGTMMKGFHRHGILEGWADTSRVTEARISGMLFNSGKGFPHLIPDVTGRQQVQGELYAITDYKKAFETLDITETAKRYHETGAFFRRAIVRAVKADGQSVLAWTYFT
ncbi:MAG: gamma-glutamylcyclotransferase, partial [Syntrophales bacterium]|nr:gamma-glutamylcyclotransferase [Syntrophales bacterium]